MGCLIAKGGTFGISRYCISVWVTSLEISRELSWSPSTLVMTKSKKGKLQAVSRREMVPRKIKAWRKGQF